MRKQTAYAFFLKHAGYSYGPDETPGQGRRRGARALARAERWARSEGLEYIEQDDDERAYCYCASDACEYHERGELDRGAGWDTIGIVLMRPCEEHGTDCKHAEHPASLWGIMDPDDAYRRVVRAELALEAMPSEERTR